ECKDGVEVGGKISEAPESKKTVSCNASRKQSHRERERDQGGKLPKCFCISALRAWLAGRAPPLGSINDLTFFQIGPTNTVTPLKQLKGQLDDVIEVQMKRYLQDRCIDGKSGLRRLLESFVIMASLLIAVPFCSFLACTVIPLSSPERGFWGNWTFNLLAHPVLNYVIARGQIEVITRAFTHQERARIRWIVRLAPLVDPPLCLLAHLIFAFAGMYPIPAAPILSCIPALFGSIYVYWWMVPKDFKTPGARPLSFNVDLCNRRGSLSLAH
ncbi:unnamed protein product, partial [Symbiodinium necroappetens]